MNNGEYEEYNIDEPSEIVAENNEEDDTQNFEVYQMLEQYMNIIQTEYKGDDASDNDGASDNQIDSSSHAPTEVTQAEPKSKKRGGWGKKLNKSPE